MADTTTVRGGSSQPPQSISEIDILWITAGLGCDGGTIAMTAAPFILVVEGSIPSENNKNKKEVYWASLGTDQKADQPITTCEWIDRLAPRAWGFVAVGTCATYGGIHAVEGNPTGCLGLPDYLGWQGKSTANIPIVCVPGCPVPPDNFMETLLYLLYTAAGRAPMLPLDEALHPKWLFSAERFTKAAIEGVTYEQRNLGRSTDRTCAS